MDAVEEIKSRLNIEDVIGEYVQLKRAGRNFKGLSPFTSERTPSFVVSPEKGIWHDFSSGKGGNVFSFVMEVEGLDFKAALELLARKAGVDLDQFRAHKSGQTGKTKERLYEALELATKFYQTQFSHSKLALEYVFKERQFTKQTALQFQLGYAPNNGNALIDFLKKKNFTDKELQQAGLTARSYRGGAQDMFRGRLMIPLADQQGRVIGFTARQLDDDPDAPKYINTPQTLLYDKGRHVYGLHLAKEALRKEGYAVIVEGNLDVLASHQAGVKQVIATAGTAMTEMHLKALSRFTGDIRLAFDQDKAGQAAAERAIPIASKVGVTLSMVTITGGKDPDELVRKDPKLWQDAIGSPDYALDWLIARYRSQLDMSTAQGKKQFSDVVLQVVAQIKDKVEQEHYLERIAQVSEVHIDALKYKLSGVEPQLAPPMRHNKAEQITDKQHAEKLRVQNQFLCLILLRPKLRTYMADVTEEMLITDEGKKVFGFLLEHGDFDGDPKILHTLFDDPPSPDGVGVYSLQDYVKMLVLQHEATYSDQDELELGYEAARLQVRLIEQFVKTKKAVLSAKLRQSDDRATAEMLEQVKKYDQLLKKAKEHSSAKLSL